VEPTARQYSVNIDVQTVPYTHVRADEAELQHTLINLLLNAIQACKPGGTVRVTAVVDEAIHIRVTDDGCGIAPEHRKHIFEPFFSMRQGGTGLGLFLSLNFVRRWGGDVVVESTPGKGSTFEVILPVLVESLAS
jgi:signal transduction histidine kinase